MATGTTSLKSSKANSRGEPAWEIAPLFPEQGDWSEEEYLALDTNKLVEFCDGRIEVLSSPTDRHQTIAASLYRAVKALITPRRRGKVLFAPLPVRLWKGRIREPDIVFLSAKNKHRINKYWNGADLVMEVVSPDDPDHDWKTKRSEYAKAGIAEYWIVDPRDETITVLALRKGRKTYRVAGSYRRGEQAASVLLAGLLIDVSAAFSGE